MNLLKFFFFTVLITFCSCSEDEVLDYEVPELSTKDLSKLLGISKEDFESQFPYAVPFESYSQYSTEEVKAYFAEENNGITHTMIFRFHEDKCISIRFFEYLGKEAMDKYFELLYIINDFSSDLREIYIYDTNVGLSGEVIKLSSINDLKNLLDDEFDVKEKTISTIWNSPNDDKDNKINLDYSSKGDSESVHFHMGR